MALRQVLPAIGLLATGLLTTTALIAPAAAQLRGAVGQQPPDYAVPTAPTATPSQGPMLPTLEDEIRANEARRKAREQARAVTSAGNPVLDPKTRGQVIRPTRTSVALRRPPNKAVPLRTGPPPASANAQALPQTIAPGLSEPLPRRPRRMAEDDPYAPLGIRVGGLILRPAIEASVGYDTNPQRSAPTSNPKSSKVYQIAPELSVQSDWSRHALQLDLRGTYNYYADVKDADRPTLDGKLTLRGDLSDQATLNLELRERIDSQRPGSPDLTSAVKGRPLTFQSGGSLGYTQNFGRVAITGTGTLDRYDFEDGKTRSGIIVSQKDRAFTQYGAKLRGAYEVTPGISPYVEVAADRRVYDQKIDSGGYERSSHGLTGKVGSTFELTRTLTGDVSVGYGMRDYTDGRLRNLSGALVDASLVWQASPLTRYTLRAGSEFIETTQAGSAGAIGRRVGIIVSHELLRNLTITNTLDYTYADYSGIKRTEQTIVAGARLDYKFNRNLVFRASYSFERAISSLPGNSTTAHVVLGGFRAQY